MTDLTDAELAGIEAHSDYPTDWLERLIAEVRRWRDKAADEAGLARLTAEIRAVRSPEGAHSA